MNQTQKPDVFVPFCETVIQRYPSVRELPAHDVMARNLCHGEIRLTLTAKTPLMISSGKKVPEGNVSVSLFATDAGGSFRIPGASLRGLIRQNMQILGLGLTRVGGGEEIPGTPVAGGKRPADGLPGSYRVPEDKDFLDYPRSIMGFVGRKREIITKYNKVRQVSDCYRTRISVGDLKAVGTPLEQQTVLLQQTLPRQDDPKFITFENGQFRLRGIRQYPLREVADQQPIQATHGIRPLATGTQFTGTIRYRNLHPDELGLLLWCLRLEEGCRHTMGMGKSAGYGQVTLTIDELLEYDPVHLYSALNAAGIHRGETNRRVSELISIYQQEAAARAKVRSLPGMPHIQSFLRLKGFTSAPGQPVQPRGSDEALSGLRAKPGSHFSGN